MRFSGATDAHRRGRERLWHKLCQLHEPWFVEFMRAWAERMEQLKQERNSRTRMVAELALRDTIARFRPITQDHARDMVLVLRRVWVGGPALYEWARHARILRPTD